MKTLPAGLGPREFDAFHDEPARWADIVADIAAAHSVAPVQPLAAGTALVALVGSELVLKVHPPFLRDHWDFERAMLRHLEGRLSLPTPRLLTTGERDGWPWQLMTQLPGVTLDHIWPTLDEAQKCAALHHIGRTAAEVHALPVDPIRPLAPAWPAFLRGQVERCAHRQQRTGLPAHLLAQLAGFLDAGRVPSGPDVLLTGEYTPFNLMTDGRQVSAMFDFGDGLIGPREYDWLGPMCFLAAGHAQRLDVFFDGYHGRPFDRGRREELLRLLLLHRYSCLPAQIALPGWEQAADFSALARLIWP
jgi:hygromycin-B 7''-O-kinase